MKYIKYIVLQYSIFFTNKNYIASQYLLFKKLKLL